MSMFYYNSGSVDQIGGIIVLPDEVVYLPFFQGLTFTLPSGLAISSEREFIWTLEQPYPGLTISNVESETPILEFSIPPFNELSITLRCSIKGQPLNFALYTLGTNLNDSLKTISVNSISTSSFSSMKLENVYITLDNSFINEAGTISQISSNLLLNWFTPKKSRNLNDYLIEKYNQGWVEHTSTTNTSISIPKQQNTYAVTPRFSGYFKTPRSILGVNDNITYAKSVISLSTNNISNLEFKDVALLPTFFTFDSQEVYEESLQNLELSSINLINMGINLNPITFFTEKIDFLYEDNFSNLELNSTQSTTSIEIVDNQPAFWINNIGI